MLRCSDQGPSVTTVAAPLVPWIDEYIRQLQFEWNDKEQPYLFFVSGDTSRNVSSSQWTTMVPRTPNPHDIATLPLHRPASPIQVKDAFAKFSPQKVGVPPKLLR